MGRIRDYIQVDGRKLWTLFDSGARNTYVTKEVAENLLTWKMPRPEPVSLGGTKHTITHACMLIGTIQGLWIQAQAWIIDELGNDEDDRRIDVLFGALGMQQWGIRPIPDEDRLDLTHYPKEFVEY